MGERLQTAWGLLKRDLRIKVREDKPEKPPTVNGYVAKYVDRVRTIAMGSLYDGRNDEFELTPDLLLLLKQEVNELEGLTSFIVFNQGRRLVHDAITARQPFVHTHDQHQTNIAIVEALRVSRWAHEQGRLIEPSPSPTVTPLRVLYKTGSMFEREFSQFQNLSLPQVDLALRGNFGRTIQPLHLVK